jgi:hypothetical protein
LKNFTQILTKKQKTMIHYKIKLTADNREAIKEIAERKGMNRGFYFSQLDVFYLINGINSMFIDWGEPFSDAKKLTFDQFKEIFDKETVSLVGRYFEALVDDADSSQTTKGEYYLIEGEDRNSMVFTSGVYPEMIMRKEYENKYYKLMPIGFDPNKGETELDKWLRETKALNLSFNAIVRHIESPVACPTQRIYEKLEGSNKINKAQILYDQWNKEKSELTADIHIGSETVVGNVFETEWQPKRGDRVLVWDYEELKAFERIFLCKIENAILPIVVVAPDSEGYFWNDENFATNSFKRMKQIEPAEPKPETDFKSKVITLIGEKINETTSYFEQQLTLKQYLSASQYENEVSVLDDLLTQIKELN